MYCIIITRPNGTFHSCVGPYASHTDAWNDQLNVCPDRHVAQVQPLIQPATPSPR